MKQQSFNILYFVRRTRLNKLGETPILTRITYNGVRAEFKLKRYVDPKKWNSAKNKVNGNDPTAVELNKYLKTVQLSLLNIHRKLEMEETEVTANRIKELYLGKDVSHSA